MKKHNFYAGPAILADEVIKQASEAALNFENTGLSLLETSHRAKEVARFMDEAEALVKELLALPSNYHVLFLSGGASSQFFMAPMNILRSGERASYLDTGSWSSKAVKEAKLFGDIHLAASSKDQNYNYIPQNYEVPKDSVFLHLTSNNTIFGTQIWDWPSLDQPIVADMSSDILSRRIPIEKFGLIYAGAQKNLGPAGTTLVIVRDDMVERTDRKLTSMLNYKSHISQKSLYNTGPVFPIYVCYLTLKWLKENGGLEVMEQKNKTKSALLYSELDRNPLINPVVQAPSDRSQMNVTFTLKDPTLEDMLKSMFAKEGCVGLAGHRSVGGFRASIYNAMDIESVQLLVDILKEFEKQKG